MENEDRFGYETLSALHGIINEESHKFMNSSNKSTLNELGKLWTNNMTKNHENGMWKKHGSFQASCSGLAVNKAVITVGAGRSFNRNKGVLKYIHDHDGRTWEEKNFVIIASNHQYKPLLEMGIIPDFVMLVDASGVVYRQLCEDIPREGNGSILIAPFHADPKVIKAWSKQGRMLKFFVASSKEIKDCFGKLTDEDPEAHSISSGGNVVNTAWMFCSKVFGSKVFMCVGNDLSFSLHKDKKEQEKRYYADGDYSTNAPGTGTGRDEAGCEKQWLSYKIRKRLIHVPGKNNTEIIGDEIVGTSHTLWVYKTWIEESMILMTKHKPEYGLHYFNCTEGGILGVLAKSYDTDEMKKEENWFMIDDVCHRWHTDTLEHAAAQFLTAKQRCQSKLITKT